MVRVEGIDRRENGAGIVHILKFYGFYEIVSVIPWLGASFAKSCGTPQVTRQIDMTPGPWYTIRRTSNERSIPMRTQSEDTSPEMERVQIELIRKAPITKRFAIMQAWSQFLIEANKQRIHKDHPDASEEEVALIFVARHYGQALADGLRADLARRQR